MRREEESQSIRQGELPKRELRGLALARAFRGLMLVTMLGSSQGVAASKQKPEREQNKGLERARQMIGQTFECFSEKAGAQE